MKILALSDLHNQDIKLIIDVVNKINPDAVLFAGDGLERLINIPYIYIHTDTHTLEFKYPQMKYTGNVNLSKVTTKSLRNNLKKYGSVKYSDLILENILKKAGIPFYYIPGNGDFITFWDGFWYLYIDDTINGQYIVQRKGKVTLTNKFPLSSDESDDQNYTYLYDEDKDGEKLYIMSLDRKKVIKIIDFNMPIDDIKNIEIIEYHNTDGIYTTINPSFEFDHIFSKKIMKK